MEMINYQEKLYWIYRKINKDRIKENHILDVRDAWHCSTVLKTKNQEEEILLFLIEIPDAIIVNSQPTPTPAAIT
jgi:ubiquitin C-terminal hydrolase